MKKARKFTYIIAGLAIYLNIGWAIGTYTYYNVDIKVPQERTILGKILAGPGSFVFSVNELSRERLAKSGPRTSQITGSIFWPFIIVAVVSTWVVYLMLWAVAWAVKLTFAGGLAKLLGLG